jgi:hypothetical protein
MSNTQVAKFTEIVATDPQLFERLGFDTVTNGKSADAFIGRVIKEANALGLEFTEAEANDHMNQLMSTLSDGELNDVQLEDVAGGKGGVRGWSTANPYAPIDNQVNYGNVAGTSHAPVRSPRTQWGH